MALFKRGRRWPWILGALILILIAGRLAAPSIVAKVIRDSLYDMKEGYHGDVRDVELNLLSGQVVMMDMSIAKRNGLVPVPFMYIPRFILGVIWKDLRPRTQLTAIDAQVHMVDAASKAKAQWGPPFELRDLREQLPFELSQIRFEGGAIYFHKFEAKPEINLSVRKLNAVWEDLDHCLPPGSASCASKLTARAHVTRGSSLSAHGTYDRKGGRSNFVANARVDDLEPVQLNALLLEYAKIDAQQGRIDLTAHYRVGDNDQRLVLVPRLYDVKVMGTETKGEVKLWREMLAGIAVGYFERKRGQKAIAYKKRGNKGEWSLIDWGPNS